MPGFSRYYSATEAEAAANMRRLYPLPTCHTPFSSGDSEQLAAIINGKAASIPRSRNDTNQPLFRQPRPVQLVEQLLNASGFSLSHETVYCGKTVQYASSSEDEVEWKTRSRTPSSDEPSPHKYRISSPALSVKIEALSTSDGVSDDSLIHATGHFMQKHQYNWGQQPEYQAIYPDDVLQSMDTQFSKWSYDNDEGTTAIPFVMANAPPETHEQLARIDRKLWIEGAEESAAEPTDARDIAQAAVRENLKQSSHERPKPSKNTEKEKDPSFEDKSVSKRAALIAKSKATNDSSLVASKSVGQRRSAMHKNKNRRSIMPSPPPTARKSQFVRKAEMQTGVSKPTVYILNQGHDEERREVDTALQSRQLDFDNRQHLEDLMHKIEKAVAGKEDNTEGRVIEEVYCDGAEQTGKSHRLKGKARKKAKN